MHWNGLLLTDAFNIKHVVTFTTFSVRTLHPQTPSSLPNYTFQKCVLLMPSWGEVVLFDDWWCLQFFGVFFFVVVFFKIFLFGFDLVFVCFLLFCCLLLDILIVSFSLYSHAQHTTKRGVRSGSSSSWTLGWQHIITLCSVRVSVWCARVWVK